MSEERNQLPEHPYSGMSASGMSAPGLAAISDWEKQVHARANELLSRRISPMKAEIERLNVALSEINSRLAEHGDAISSEEVSGLIEEIKQWYEGQALKAEEDFKLRLEESAAKARREAEIQIEEMRQQLLESSHRATDSASSSESSSKSFEMFALASENIISQRSQSDILAALVKQVAEFAPRVIFFVIKSGEALGWKARGFENGLNDESVKLLSVPAQKPRLLREALSTLQVAQSDPQSVSDENSGVSEALGPYSSPTPGFAIAIPLIVLNKAVALLYADSGEQSVDSLNLAAAESLTRIAGKTIEFLHSRRGAEGPRGTSGGTENPSSPLKTDGKAMGAAIQQTSTAQLTAPAPVQESPRIEPVARPEFTREIPREIIREAKLAREAQAQQPEEPKETPKVEKPPQKFKPPARITAERRWTQELPLSDKESQLDEGLRQAEAQLPGPTSIETESEAKLEPSNGKDAEPGLARSGRLWMSPEALKTQEIEKVEKKPAVSEPAANPMQTMEFPAPPVESSPAQPEVNSFSPPPAPPVFISPAKPTKSSQSLASVPGSETEQRAHNDARRFARLLVSEIKLYNAAKVNDGRRNFDLYDRLKDEIDRSRKVYDKRVAPAVASRFDYFYDELVQTLAEGDPSKLGKDCPGPVAVA